MGGQGLNQPSLPVVLDSGGVFSLADQSRRATAVLQAAREQGSAVLIPAVVIAETFRPGPRNARVHRVLKLGTTVEVDDALARLAGTLLVRSEDSSQRRAAPTIDALVLAVALQHGGGVIVTSDQPDLLRLVDQARDLPLWNEATRRLTIQVTR